MSIIGHITLQNIVAHDFRYDPRISVYHISVNHFILYFLLYISPSGRTMTLELTQPLTEMSTRIISWKVKTAGA